VLKAALAMVDREGLDSLSMRKVAGKLGVEAMSLYNHVASKEDLVEALVALVIDEIEVPPAGTPWRDAMRARALSTRAVFLRHPTARVLMDSCTTMTESRLRYSDAVVGLLMADGFTVAQAYRAFLTLDSYIYGFTLQELSWPHPEDSRPADDAATVPQLSVAAFPRFAQVMGHVMGEVGRLGLVAAYKAEFEFGLDLILDSLERLRASSRKAEPAPKPGRRH
jgi:AcrR family transcriptional regulator